MHIVHKKKCQELAEIVSFDLILMALCNFQQLEHTDLVL